MRFILFEILSGDSADFYALQDAIPYIGRQQFAPKWLPDAGRLIQTHESYCDRGDRKIIFLVRDPRSVVVSQYYWYKRDGRIAARGADDFVSEWIHGSGVPWDSWARHASFWLDSESARNNRLHLVRYEDLKRDPMGQIQGVLGFLGVSKEPAVIRTAIDNNTLERMKAKEETRSRMKVPDDPRFRFIRSGSTSGWRKELSAASQRSITEAFHDTLSRLRYETDLD